MRLWFCTLIFAASLMADYTAQPVDPKIVSGKIKIIDIRTPDEWRETGILKGAIPIMFFDEQGNYDLPKFITQLDKRVKKGEKFALICRTGSRTQILGNHLGRQMGYNVIDLQGGMMSALRQKIPTEPYKPKP
jgi:rhodanese-related sulfurtransferase